MEIKVNKTVREIINLNENEVNEIATKRLLQLVAPGEYLREEKGKIILKQDEPHWRHGSVSEDYVRDATELDIAVFKVLKALS